MSNITVTLPIEEYERLKHINNYQLTECFKRLNFVMDNYKGNVTNVFRNLDLFKKEMARDYYFNIGLV